MARKRDHISDTEKLAAALVALGLIPRDDAKAMGRTNLLSCIVWDHNIRHADGGTDDFWNLTPMLIPAHRKKTTEKDVPEMARDRDIKTSEAIHKARLASKAGDYKGAAQILASAPKKGRLKPKQKIASRGFDKGHRPLRSRGFERRA
jgi:hypothetical protein